MNVLFCLVMLAYGGNMGVAQRFGVRISLYDKSNPSTDLAKILAARSPRFWMDGTFQFLSNLTGNVQARQCKVAVSGPQFAGLRYFEKLWLANTKINGDNLQCATATQPVQSGSKCCKFYQLRFHGVTLFSVCSRR
ncbi:hypothetical protein P879_11872 [Paragonimus westermani]|uniref:Uncharacterized protein n=1 Tax=Paragonimus westermani TaxID=34504 RepID=A0A8T0DAJ9_9TREM|nr:hypothetical protein P879_11872 [Paragonimus westermani]